MVTSEWSQSWRVATKWLLADGYKPLFTNEWLQGNDQPKVGIGPKVPITFGGSWSRVIRTGIAYSNNFTVWAARLGIHLIRLA